MKTKLNSAFSLQPSAFALLAAFTLFTASPRATAQSVWGRALSFDGVDDHVRAGPVNLANASFTLQAWARRSSTSTPDWIVGQGQAEVMDHGLHFGFHHAWGMENKFVFGFYYNDLATMNPYADTAWHHWAGTYDAVARERRIYRDGVLVAADTNVTAYQGTGDLRVGFATPWTANSYFHGQIDDVRIWNRARTHAEIATDMLHPLAGTESNLVAYWRFDETEGDTVLDSTTNHCDGFLTNGPARMASSVIAPNLVVNPGFEDGTTGWNGFGWSTFLISATWPHSGIRCAHITNRTNTWSGLAQQFKGVLQPGITYHLSAWVRLANSASGPASLNFAKTDDSGTVYTNVARGTATSNEWTQLKGTYRLSVTGSLTDLTLYMDGPGAGTNFYADDFVIVPEILEVPLLTTLPATNLLASAAGVRATLRGAVIPNGGSTTAWFEYGTNGLYDQATAPAAIGSGWEAVSVSRTVLGLTAGSVYHYRAVASNSLGVARGAEQSFWLPDLRLNGPNPLTNECHVAFEDPGATVIGSPLAIAAGDYHNLVLKADGTVVGWGDNFCGLSNGALAGGDVVAIAAGGRNNLALKADGTVYGWGCHPNTPADLNNVVAIAAGGWHSVALKADGTIVEWDLTGIPAGLNNVVAIAAGGSGSVSPSGHTLALKADGTVVGWGVNNYGEANGALAGGNVVAIAAGSWHSLALKADGTVVGWGNNDDGQANGTLAGSNVVAIAAGGYHSLALKADRTVIGWGENGYRQANGALAGSNVVAIAAGIWHSLALKTDGTVVGWGLNDYGQTNIPADLSTLNLPIGVTGTVNPNTPGAYSLTYRTTNTLGAVTTVTRTVRVVDTCPSELTLLGANPLALTYRAPFVDPGATATDLCGGDLTASILVTGNVDVNRLGTYPLTYTVTDPGGNSVSTNRTVQVMTAPSFTHGDSDGDGVVDQTEFDAVARDYWGPTSQPYMTNVVTDGQGLFQMTLTNAAAWNFSVEVSTNLVNWDYLGPAWPFLQFNDPAAPAQPQRYYRLRWP